MRDGQKIQQYNGHATAITTRWPHVASVLRWLAAAYEDQGRDEDLELELHDDLAF